MIVVVWVNIILPTVAALRVKVRHDTKDQAKHHYCNYRQTFLLFLKSIILFRHETFTDSSHADIYVVPFVDIEDSRKSHKIRAKKISNRCIAIVVVILNWIVRLL